MRKPISKVANRDSGVMACPQCGGSSFTAKRSKKGKVLGGFVFAPKSQVKCDTCGAMYKRG